MPTPDFVDELRGHLVRPETPAIRSSERTVSYRQLGELISDLAGQLADMSLSTDQPVCVPARKSAESIALILAVIENGHQVLVPSPELGDATLHRLIEQVGCAGVVSAERDATGAPRLVLDRQIPAAGAAAAGLPRRSDAVLLLTTSGSTGVPKVVPIPVEAARRFMGWAAETFSLHSGVALSYAPLNFDLSLLDVWATLRAGGCVRLVDQDRSTDPFHLAEAVADDVTVIQAIPLFYRLLADGLQLAGNDERTGGAGPDQQVGKSAEQVIFTGDAMPVTLLPRVAEIFENAHFYNLYGCTETNDTLLAEIDLHNWPRGRELPLGRPLPGVTVQIVGEDGEPLAGPGIGELLVSSPFQSAGYLDARLTAAKFVRQSDGRAYFRTGDIVTRDAAGVITLRGRVDHQVKVRGVRTNLEEVERVIRAHPNIREAAVIDLPDDVEGVRLHAVVQCHGPAGLNSLEVRQFCSRYLPRTAIPSAVTATADPLPRTNTGKLDRKSIRRSMINSAEEVS